MRPEDPRHLSRHTYVRLTVQQLWENLPSMLLASLLFSICWAPAFFLATLGLWMPALMIGVVITAPGWTALLAHEAEMVLRPRSSIRTMFKAWPRFWARSVGLGLLGCLPLLAMLLTLPILSHPRVPLIAWLGLAADASALIILTTLYLYAFPVIALYDADLYTALRSALILASRHIHNSLGLLAMGVLFAFAVFYISPGLLFILPAVWGIFIVNNCRMVVDEEMAQADEETRGR